MRRSRLTAGVTLPREPKQERSRRKQMALMTAAERLFADPGFEHVTADDIAADAGYGTGTFYNYFTNKTQAFLMVAGRHETAIAPTLESVSAQLSAGAPLGDIAESIVRSVIEDRRRVPWLRRTWLRLSLTDPDVGEVQRRIDEEWDAGLANLVAEILANRPVLGLDPTAGLVGDGAAHAAPPPAAPTPAARTPAAPPRAPVRATSAQAIATTIRVLVDALADEVVLVGSIDAQDAAASVGFLLDGLAQGH